MLSSTEIGRGTTRLLGGQAREEVPLFGVVQSLQTQEKTAEAQLSEEFEMG